MIANKDLIRNAVRYGEIFARCYEAYCRYKNDNSSSHWAVILQNHTNNLSYNYRLFALSLSYELLRTTDWDEQNILFVQLQLLMSDVVFDNEILNTDKTVLIRDLVGLFENPERKQCYINDYFDDCYSPPPTYNYCPDDDYGDDCYLPFEGLTPEEEIANDKIMLIEAVQCMSQSLQWFRLDDKYRLRSTLNVLRQQGIIIESVETVPKYDEVIPLTAIDEDALIITPDEETGKNPIPRDGIWFLFTMLRQKKVIKQMPDTELSDIVSTLTEYSAKKLRQSKLKTQPAKDKLTSLLEEILSKIKA